MFEIGKSFKVISITGFMFKIMQPSNNKHMQYHCDIIKKFSQKRMICYSKQCRFMKGNIFANENIWLRVVGFNFFLRLKLVFTKFNIWIQVIFGSDLKIEMWPSNIRHSLTSSCKLCVTITIVFKPIASSLLHERWW